MTCGETPLDQPPDPSQPAEPDDLGEDFDTLFATDLMEMMFETMRLRPNEDASRQDTRRKAAVTALAALQAHGPVDMMFAAHAVASHHAAMECFRRAMLAVNDPDAASRMQRSGIMLSRMMAQTVKDLSGRQDRNSGGKTP